MKSSIKIYHLIILFSLAYCTAFSQVQYSRKYRVIAYKKFNPFVSSMSNEVEILPAMTIYVPNTFTPNGDGLNDSFGIAGEAIKELHLVIYNRWGQKIFETNNINDRWDGTFNGTLAPQGSYSYNVSAQGPTGAIQNKKGTFNLIQ